MTRRCNSFERGLDIQKVPGLAGGRSLRCAPIAMRHMIISHCDVSLAARRERILYQARSPSRGRPRPHLPAASASSGAPPTVAGVSGLIELSHPTAWGLGQGGVAAQKVAVSSHFDCDSKCAYIGDK